MMEALRSNADHLLAKYFLSQITAHAVQALADSPANMRYAQQVLARSTEVKKVLDTGSGRVDGVVMNWRDAFTPIAQIVFGPNWVLDETLYRSGQCTEWGSTVFDGVNGQVCVVSLDEIMGPCLSLNLQAGTPETSP